MNVAVVGASDKPSRYSFQAIQALLDAGHRVFPVHPKIKKILDLPVYSDMSTISESLHTITLYVNQERSTAMMGAILALHPARLIFNPGAENQVLYEKAQTQGIHVLNACTLVMLSTHQFESAK